MIREGRWTRTRERSAGGCGKYRFRAFSRVGSTEEMKVQYIIICISFLEYNFRFYFAIMYIPGNCLTKNELLA